MMDAKLYEAAMAAAQSHLVQGALLDVVLECALSGDGSNALSRRVEKLLAVIDVELVAGTDAP